MTTHPSPTLFAVPRERVAELSWNDMPAGDHVQTKTLYTTGRASAGLMRLAPGAHELTHLHMNGEHHLWVLAGTIRIDDTDLPAGSYLHVPAHLAHTVEDGGSGSTAFYVFCPAD
jgi:mannose-6-phosphate isomerase-like protein (cupin superfamily)